MDVARCCGEDIDLPGEMHSDCWIVHNGDQVNNTASTLSKGVKEMEEVIKCRLLTVKQVAQMLNIGKSSVYAYADNGALRAIYMPLTHDSQAIKRNRRTLRFNPEEIDRFLKELTVLK